MGQDDIERWLDSEEAIDPPPNFTGSVMRAVREAAITPEPIAFPWRRAMPGLVICGAGFLAALVLLGAAFLNAPMPESPEPWVAPGWLTSDRVRAALVLCGALLVGWLASHLSQSRDDVTI